MNKYEIVLESSADLNAELRSKFNIYPEFIKNVVYMPNGVETEADMEWKNYSTDEFFKIVKDNAGEVKTAFAGYDEFSKIVEPILRAGRDIIIPVISTGISGTFNGFNQWASLVLEEYPDRKITVIDSLKYSSAVGLLAIYAAINRENGMSYEENVLWLNENKNRLHESGVLDDLRFLAKNGRISAGKAFFGSLVGVQPFADFTFDGKNQPLGTIKGADAVDKLSLDYMLRLADKIEDQVVLVTHSCRKERAEKFVEQLLKVAKPKEVIITHVGQTCGPNIGPGLCTYFFLGSKIENDRAKEVALFEELKNK